MLISSSTGITDPPLCYFAANAVKEYFETRHGPARADGATDCALGLDEEAHICLSLRNGKEKA